MTDEELEAEYNAARREFQEKYKIFEMLQEVTYKRKKLVPSDVERLQQAWNRYLPLRKKFKGF